MDISCDEKFKLRLEYSVDKKAPIMFTDQYPPPPLSKVSQDDTLNNKQESHSPPKCNTMQDMTDVKQEYDSLHGDKAMKMLSSVEECSHQIESDEGQLVTANFIIIINITFIILISKHKDIINGNDFNHNYHDFHHHNFECNKITSFYVV